MKFNMKNRPRIQEKHMPTPELFELYGNVSAFDLAAQHRKQEAWFKGFEKELRVRLEFALSIDDKTHAETLKEILGE